MDVGADCENSRIIAGVCRLGLCLTASLLIGCGVWPSDARAEMPQFRDPNVLVDRPVLSGLPRLRFLTTLDFPPFNFSDANKRPTGFNIDMARAICAVLEIEAKCEIQALPWDELGPALRARRGEAIIAGTAITSEARAQFGLTHTYFRLPARFMARRDNNDWQADEATGFSGRSVAVEAGTAHAAILEKYYPEAQRIELVDQQAAYAALRDGTADYILADGMSLSFFMSAPASDACCMFVGPSLLLPEILGNGMAIATRPDDAALLQALDHALTVVERDGTTEEIFARYFPLSPFAPAGAPGIISPETAKEAPK